MTRGELMRRMSGQEFSAWGVLFNLKAEEADRERDIAEHGEVIVTGLDREEPDIDYDDEDADWQPSTEDDGE